MGVDLATVPDEFKRYLAPAEKKRLGVAALTLDELISRQTIKTEKQLQQQIADYLRLRGIPFYRSRMDKRTTNKRGQPDFLCCVARPIIGRFVAFECKLPGQHPTEEQQRELEAIRNAGGIAAVVYDLIAVKTILDSL